jgi:urease accessory protein
MNGSFAGWSWLGRSESIEVVRGAIHLAEADRPVVSLKADRHTLAKRRWRGAAEDGRQFGFALEKPLQHRNCFFESTTHAYVIEQTQEPVLIVALTTAEAAARVAWHIGNLHFPLALRGNQLVVEDDTAIRQLFDRENIPFATAESVFQPLSGAFHHSH